MALYTHIALRFKHTHASGLLRAARMARADTIIVCLLPLAKNAMHSPTSIIYIYIKFELETRLYRWARSARPIIAERISARQLPGSRDMRTYVVN